MPGEHNEFKVGLTVVVVTALFVVVLVFIGKWDTMFRVAKPLEVRFNHTAGIQSLRVKDPVRVGGVNVGRVRKIWLQMDKTATKGTPREELFVHVLAEIPTEVQIYTDGKIGIGTKFVGEGGTLDILDTGRGGKPLGPKDILDGEPPAGFNEVTAQVSRELDPQNPNGLLTQIKKQLDPNLANSLVAKIHMSMDDLNAVTAQIKNQLNDKEQASLLAKMQATMSNLKSLMESARKMIEQAGPHLASASANVDNISMKLVRELDKADNASLLTRLHASLASAQAGMENLKIMTQTGKEILVLNRDNLQAIVDNFAETSAHLKATAQEVRRNPWRLLYTPNKPEAEYANLMESARAFSDAAGALDQANLKLKKVVELHPQSLDPNDPQLTKVREEIKKAFCDFEQAQKKLWGLLKLKS